MKSIRLAKKISEKLEEFGGFKETDAEHV